MAGQPAPWNGLGVGMHTLWRLADAESRSISPENPDGSVGGGGRATTGTGADAARHLGVGWKVSPSVDIPPGVAYVMADIEGPGAIQHIWLTPRGESRDLVLRIYWDGSDLPSVECPVSDFFASGWGRFAQINSLAVTVNPGSGFNCYWEMPFTQQARITLTNEGDVTSRLYYQVDYSLCAVPADAARFCAQFRRVNPTEPGTVVTILDGVAGRGQYVGTACAWGAHDPIWWGEGEVKFFIDGDSDFPTICGTGVEDYFGGAYNFEVAHRYTTFSGPYTGLPYVGMFAHQQRFAMYRWHVTDPVRFTERIEVTMQAIGYGHDQTYRPLADDVATVAFWYQTLPMAPFPTLPDRSARAID